MMQDQLANLYQARLDGLKELCITNNLSKSGSVEQIRARLISNLVLSDWDLSDAGIQTHSNTDLGQLLATFGIKRSGSVKDKRRRLWLHLNRDPKHLNADQLDEMNRDELHELCQILTLPRSGTKSQLLARVAGVLSSQEGSWGKVKKSLRRPKAGTPKTPIPPSATTVTVEDSVAEEQPVGQQIEDVTVPVEIVSESVETGPAVKAEELSEGIEMFAETMIAEESPAINANEEKALIEMESRTPELESLIRDFLLVGDSSDEIDVNAFIDSLSSSGFDVDLPAVRRKISDDILGMRELVELKRSTTDIGPGSWREREAIRQFEKVRLTLVEGVETILDAAEGDMVQARMAMERLSRENGLDLRMPAISGRVHALFDLQVSLNAETSTQDPKVARQERVVRLLQHGAVHLSVASQKTLNRLERNISGFEQVVDAIMRKQHGEYGPASQALLIRFLEGRGYEVNTAELRPRVIASGGIFGVELGYLSPRDIPKLPPGISLSESEVEVVVAELRRLARQFRPETEYPDDDETQSELELGEAVADANDSLMRMRGKLDRADDLLKQLELED